MITTAVRYHDISCGHIVTNHKGSCKQLHGHNYRIYFFIKLKKETKEDMVIDFSEIKNKLCKWLDDNYDHRFLIWSKDTRAKQLKSIDNSVVITPFNPTAENIARYLVEVIGKKLLNKKLILYKCVVQETVKCSGVYEINS
jgi:6-pyruvoyltetrahydropterin/6-carboxytetrahydropterin synthase